MRVFAKVEGRHYMFERPEVDSRSFIIDSWAKHCPMCLAGWAHFTCVLDGPRMKGYHRIAGQLCPRCARTISWHPLAVPGSLLEEPWSNCQTADLDLLNYLPLELLRREFDLHYEFLVKQETANASITTEYVGQRCSDTDTSNERPG